MDPHSLDFDLPKHRSSAIKVIGVGGGGSNAVNYMKNQGIRGVDFIVCNTDAQALDFSPVENKIQLGATLTEGLGAGANPEVGEQAALESYEEIQAVLGAQTKMVFITAGMGGGTGTGAAPIIAMAAREMGILTVGIVTAPFGFEGSMRLRQAELGIERLREHVDSLIVINNNKLREVYGNLGFKQGFMKADEVLSTAARGIAEVITHHYSVNIDLRDAKTVLHNSGTAIMGSAKATGSTRALSSVRSALDSPLLNDNHIEGARSVLLLIVSGSGEHEVTLDEIGEINDYIQDQAGRQVDIIMGIGEDPHLDGALQVTVIATGFSATNPIGTVNPAEPEKVIYELQPDSTPGSQFNLFDEPVRSKSPLEESALSPTEVPFTQALAPEPVVPTEAPVAYALDSESGPGFDLAQEPAHHAHPNPEEALASADAEVESEFSSDISFELSTALPWDAPEALTPEAPEAAFPETALEDEATEEAQEFELLVEPHEEAAPEISAELSHEDEPLHEEASPSMTWTLDWKDEPAKPSKEFGLDEFLAFEASLREDAPAPATADPVAFSPEPVAFSPEPVAFSPEPVAFSPEPVAFSPEPEAFSQQPEAFSQEPVASSPEQLASSQQPAASSPEVQFELRTAPAVATMTTEIDPDRDSLEDTMRRMAQERRAYLQTYNHHFGQNQARMQQGDLERPAFERQGWDLDASARYSQQNALGDHMVRGEKNDLEFRPNNSFLHDNVD
jgi:cell division protein FtsZ